jgi:hypothetical protein
MRAALLYEGKFLSAIPPLEAKENNDYRNSAGPQSDYETLNAATRSLENSYYPEHDRGFGETIGRFVGSIGSDATSNLLREFWPDIKRIFRKHEPQKIKTIEEKFPHPKKPVCK